MIATPQPGAEFTDPTTGQRLVIASVDQAKNKIMFARFGYCGPRVETMTITDFFNRFMRPNLPDESEVNL